MMYKYRKISQSNEISEADLNKMGSKGFKLCKCYTYLKTSPYPIPMVAEKDVPMPGPIDPIPMPPYPYRDVLMHVYIFGKKDPHEPLKG
jgi:hypothetical protein